MMEEKLIAPCGMNCSVCISYLAMKNKINDQGFNRKYCEGCRPRGKNCTFMSHQCELVGKGLVRFCSECDEFPCKRLISLDNRYRSKYHMSMIDNLNEIREHGMTVFLEKEKAKWQCPSCGGVISCHNGLCLQCSLDRYKNNKKYCWEKE